MKNNQENKSINKFFIYVLLLSILLAGTVCGIEVESKYYVKAYKIDLNAISSYPQRAIRIISNKPTYELEVVTCSGEDKIKSVKYVKYDYPVEILEYLKPADKIESDSEEIKELANLICKNEDDIINIARKTAQWTSKNIIFDNDLAEEIWKGNVKTQSAVKTLKRKKGTCSEYANVFIAVMRALGIPTRFICGYTYGGGKQGSYHAWAEIYLYGVGWIPADPQMGKIGVTDKHIKLFYGKDFVDINVPLKDIGIRVIKME